jgi:hypothetical protein
MPKHVWQIEPLPLIQQFERRHNRPEAGALIAWAVYAVESLHYLDDLDLAFARSSEVCETHDPATVDVAHTRWATGTCITALDLCAAGLARIIHEI